MAGVAVKPKILRDPPARLGTRGQNPSRPPTIRRFVPSAAAASLCPMRGQLSGVLDEVRLQLELD